VLSVLIQSYVEDKSAESGTTTTNIKITGHGLSVGDHIINATRNSTPPAYDNIASRRVSAVVDGNNVTVQAISDQTSGDTIKLFKHLDKTDTILARTLRITRESEGRHTCNITIKSTTAYVPLVGQDMIIKNDGDIIFGGVIKSVKRKLLQRSGVILYDVFSDGYTSIPARRTVTGTFDNTDAGTLVEHYVDTVLYQEGITKGTINTGATLIEYDAVCKSIKEIYDELASASGYKWYIDADKQLHFLQDDIVTDASHTIDNSTFTDFSIPEYDENIDNYRNKQFIRGTVGDDGYIVQHEATQAAQVTIRQNIEGTSGYYGNVLNDTNIDNSTDADTTAENLLKRYGGSLPSIFNFETGTLDFEPNTKLTVDLSELGISESYFLIEEVSIYDLDGKNLRASVRAVQRDGSSFSTQKNQDFVGYFSKLVELAKSSSGGGGIVFDGDGGAYTVNLYVQPSEPTSAKGKSVWVDTDDPTIDDGTTTTTLTWASPRQVNATSNVTLPNPASAKAIEGSTAHSGVVMFCIRNANTDNGVISVGYDSFTVYLFPQQSVAVRCIGTAWEVV